MPILTELERDSLEQDLIDLEVLIEKEEDLEELKILCARKQRVLMKLGKNIAKDWYCPLDKKRYND